VIPVPHVYTIQNREDGYNVGKTLEDNHAVEKRGKILALNDQTEEFTDLHYRVPVITVNENVLGDVSASDDYYHVHKFSDIIRNVVHASEDHDDYTDLSGHVIVTEDDRKLSSYLEFDGVTAEPFDGDAINVGVKTRPAHTGMHGTRYDGAATRLVCSNGMTKHPSQHLFPIKTVSRGYPT
jgi:hypothetical protein